MNFGACGGRKHAVMSTSPTNSDDRLGQVAQPFRCAKDESLLSALSSVPDFPFADATCHPVDRQSDNRAEAATTSGPPPYAPSLAEEGAGDSYVKRSQTIIYVPHKERQRLPRGNERPPLNPARVTVMSTHDYADLGIPPPRSRRPGQAFARVKKMLGTGTIAAVVTGAVVGEIWLLVEDADLPVSPPLASRAPPLPQAAPPSTEFRTIIDLSEAERITPAISLQPLQSTAQSENQPAESRIAATLPPIAPSSAYEKISGDTAATPEPPWIAIPQPPPISTLEPPPLARLDLTPIATPEPPSIATREPPSITPTESAPIARPEPTLEAPRINQAPPRGKVVAADRAGFLLADSNVRYLTRVEMQGLSADQLHIARNEIFARRGRYFKDDGLRTYFSQFPWYQPRAWDIPLSPVERANVGLIQSIEAPAAASRGITGPLPPRTEAENGVAFADPSRRYLTPEELQGLAADQLVIVRNEIFARRGRYFKDDALRAYFSQFPWYQPYAWDVPLSAIEQANVKLLQSFEQTASTARPASRAGRVPPM